MLASREQLERHIATASAAVGRQAVLDGDFLDDVLKAASDRIVQAVPERTLELTPRPTDAVPTPDPVALTFDLEGQRVVQVPDLRELVSATLDGQDLELVSLGLRRRPHELCALWLRLPYRRTGALELVGHWGPAGVRVGDEDLPVAESVRDACVTWAARAYWNRASRGADNVSDPAGGSVLGYFRNLPPDVKVVLDGLTIPGV